MRAHSAPDKSPAREARFALGGAELYYRDIGRGTPIVALHGGPDFDHQYLLPDLDRLADSCRLIYYAQRGRGASRGTVQAEERLDDSGSGWTDSPAPSFVPASRGANP